MQIYRPNITFFESDEMLYKQTADAVADILLDVTGNQGLAKMALAGGSTPMKLYKKLGNNPVLPWESVELYQVDERFIFPEAPESNQYNIVESFGEETIERMKDSFFFKTGGDISTALANYDEVLNSIDGQLFDVTILGIGNDGHFASLFPGGEYLSHQDAKAISTQAGQGFDVSTRLSLTIESVLSSEVIIVLLKGEDKKDVIKELMEGKKTASEYPAKFLLSHPNLYIYQSLEGVE